MTSLRQNREHAWGKEHAAGRLPLRWAVIISIAAVAGGVAGMAAGPVAAAVTRASTL